MSDAEKKVLSPPVIQQVYELSRLGLSKNSICALVGVERSKFEGWMELGAKSQNTLESELRAAYFRGFAELERYCLENVLGSQDWKASYTVISKHKELRNEWSDTAEEKQGPRIVIYIPGNNRDTNPDPDPDLNQDNTN